ncbi:BspA family leucine-rich repeat surface protein [Shivajiella indica]|uniref:BspA family leucine-rich repeat surface protein n=1 Tax=Shivajiella indica TaxID=872115 RepID=A0ABW5B1Q3_9BACT
MKAINFSGKTLLIALLLTMSACFEMETFNSNTGDVVFKGFGIELFQTGGANDRILAESTWKHVYKNTAKIEIENKVNGQKYTLDYNPNNFTQAYKITLPFGDYSFRSVVEGGEFEPFLPFEASGEFTLSSESMDITLQATTDYGLVTVNNRYVSSSVVSTGENSPVNLAVLGDDSFRFIYAKGSTPTKLEIIESYSGTTIERNLEIVKYWHYNFILELSEGNVNFIDLVMGAFEYEEEVIELVSGKFYDANGTIKCPDAQPGDKGIVKGKIYEAVDRELLIQRRDEGADLTCVCTSLVTDMSSLFEGNYGDFMVYGIQYEFNQSISNWDVSNVTNMSWMFSVSTFNQPISNWDVSNVTDMFSMFLGSEFNQPIGEWDVSNVTAMSGMFYKGKFNQPIGNWDVSNVKSMNAMFKGTPFNQPIGNWDVRKVTSMVHMFAESPFNQPIGKWNVSNVENMEGMFKNSNFDHPIGGWDVSNVRIMISMFEFAPFNQNLENWDISNVVGISFMFLGSSFDQNLGNWTLNQNISSIDSFLSSRTSRSNYENTLLGWSNNALTPKNVTMISGLEYCDEIGRNVLINNFGWDIIDIKNCD